jgi:anti-sigma regulatory factor (Ser/Thr protein kinase)
VPQSVSAELTLSGVTASVPLARRFVRSTLQSWERDGLIETAVLVVSELATNAVLHARSAFTVTVVLDEHGSLRIEVLDGSPKLPMRRPTSRGATTGRGLAIVQGLATDWGSEPVETGKRIWVQLDHEAANRRPEPSRSRRSSQGSGRSHPRTAAPGGNEARAA